MNYKFLEKRLERLNFMYLMFMFLRISFSVFGLPTSRNPKMPFLGILGISLMTEKIHLIRNKTRSNDCFDLKIGMYMGMLFGVTRPMVMPEFQNL